MIVIGRDSRKCWKNWSEGELELFLLAAFGCPSLACACCGVRIRWPTEMCRQPAEVGGSRRGGLAVSRLQQSGLGELAGGVGLHCVPAVLKHYEISVAA